MPFSFDDLPDGWYRLEERIPRRNERVRIVKANGLDMEARFEVAYTSNWPSGASWRVASQEAALPFSDVIAWSLNATTSLADAVVTEASPAPESDTDAWLLQALRHDIEQTQQLLRRIPPSHIDWSPRSGVPSMRALSLRLISIVARTEWILDLDVVEAYLEPEVPDLPGLSEIVYTFDANAASVVELLGSGTGVDLSAPWRLERNGHLLVELSRANALQEFSLSSLAYHRGALSLLLSALGVPVPPSDPIWGFQDGELGQDAKWNTVDGSRPSQT